MEVRRKAPLSHNWKKIIATTICLLFVVAVCYLYFPFVCDVIQEARIEDELNDKKLGIDVLGVEMDTLASLHGDWEDGEYLETLVRVVNMMDREEQAYVGLFDKDMGLLSSRSERFAGYPLELGSYSDFVEESRKYVSGEFKVWYESPASSPHWVYLYYRWIPTDSEALGRVLIVTGVSRYTLEGDSGLWHTYGLMAMMLLAVVLMTRFFISAVYESIQSRRRVKEGYRVEYFIEADKKGKHRTLEEGCSDN